MLDAFVKITMVLAILLVVVFIGPPVAAQFVSTPDDMVTIMADAPEATVAPTPITADAAAELERTINDAFGRLPMIILAMVGGIALSAVCAIGMTPYESAPRARTTPVPRAVAYPGGHPVVPAPEPTDDDILARDPEIAGLNKEISNIDVEIASLREARRQRLAGRRWRDRAVLWLKHRA
jgi:ABC-type Fe3+-hydroxamate transport system substrate-binding protein